MGKVYITQVWPTLILSASAFPLGAFSGVGSLPVTGELLGTRARQPVSKAVVRL